MKRDLVWCAGNPLARTVYLVSLLFVLSASLTAQFDVATLSGTVSDPSGAVIPGVQVTATNEATNAAVSVTTNESGRYLFPSLRPGAYKITASHQGFKQFVSSGV